MSGRGDRRVRLTAAQDDGYGPPRRGYDDYEQGGSGGARRPPAGGRDAGRPAGRQGGYQEDRRPVGKPPPARGGGRRDEQASEEFDASEGEEVAEDPRGARRAADPRARSGRDAAPPQAKSRHREPEPAAESPPPVTRAEQARRPALPAGNPSEPPPRSAVPLSVSGCSNATISAIVKGNYSPYSSNHGKVVYRKDEKAKGFEVLIYYWDDRDGPEGCGWWFGPNVGGDQVWAYHPSRSSTSPPSSEWNVPHDGPIDPTFAVSARVDSRRQPAPPPSRPAKEQVPEPAPEQPRSRGGREEDHYSEPPIGQAPARRLPSPPPAPRRGERAEPAARDARTDPYAREEARADPYAREERATSRDQGGQRAASRDQRERPAYEDDRREASDNRGEKQAPDDGREGGSRTVNAHSKFVEAYNKRRQAAEQERRGDQPQDEEKAPRDDREASRGAPDREASRGAPERSAPERGAPERGAPERGAPERGAPERGAPERGAPERGAPERGDDRRRDAREEESRRGAPERRGDRREEPQRQPERTERTRSPVGGRSPAGRRGEPPSGGDRRDQVRGSRDEPPARGRDEPARGGRDNDRDRRGGGEDRRRETESRRDEERRRTEDRRRVEEERAREDDKRRDEDRKRKEEDRRKDDERRQIEKAKDEVVSAADKAKREEERKKKEEEMKVRDEELQKKRDEKRAEERVKQEKLEAQRREENSAKRAEDMERLAKQKEERKQQEEQEAKEALERRTEEQQAMRQQQATLNVLQVLQKLSSATPDNFDELKKDLDAALLTELPECGQQQDILKAEADRVLEYARHYVKQVTDAREHEESSRVLKETTAKALLDELQKLVTAAEEQSEAVFTTAGPLAGELSDLPDLELVKVSRDVQRLGRAAMAACSQCADFITHKRPIIEEADTIGEESAAIIAVLLPRIRSATRRTAEAFQQGKENREKVEKRVLANRYVAKKEALFSKYDKDGDGYMNIEDVVEYAKAEFSFEIPAENLARIERKLFQGEEGSIGVAKEHFQLIKAAVGIARAEVLGAKQKKDRIEREEREAAESERRTAELEARKLELQDILRDAAKSLTKLEPAIKQAEAIAEALAGEAGQLGSEDLKAKSNRVDAETKETRQILDDLRNNIQNIMAEVGEVPELQNFMRGILVPLSSRSDIFDMRLRKALETAASGRQLAQYMALSEYEGLWTEVVVKLRASIESIEGKSVDDLFDYVAGSDITVPENAPGSENDTITTAEIQAFLHKASCDVEIIKLDKLFGKRIDGSSASPVIAIADGAEEGDAKEAGKDAEESSKTEGADETKDEETSKEDKKEEEGNGAAKEGAAKKDADEDLGSLKVTELKERCKLKGLKAAGSKAELIARLKEAAAEDKKEEEPAKKEEDAEMKDAEEKKAEGEEKKDDEATKDGEEGDEKADGKPPVMSPPSMSPPSMSPPSMSPPPADGLMLDIMAAANAAAAKLGADAQEAREARARNSGGLNITRSDFKRIIRMYYKVVRHCVLSDNLQIEQSSQIRRMDVGEVIEVHRGPTLDQSVNVYRVFGRCIRDGINGWATIAGNTGVTFLMPGGRIFTVKIQVPLTEDLKDVEGEKLVRQLKEGEVLEVLEWARTSRSALGVTRIRARAQLDNAVGWATTIGNDERVYLEAM